MHRCLRPHALPARARCVPNFLALNTSSPPRWQQTLPWRCYTTAVPEQCTSEPAQSLDPSTLVSDDGTTNTSTSSLESPNDHDDASDALDFILEGYETKPKPVDRTVKSGRARDNFDKYEKHLGTRTRQGASRSTGLSRRPIATRGIQGAQKGSSPSPKTAKVLPSTRKHGKQPFRPGNTRPLKLENSLRKAPRTATLWARPRWVSIASMGQSSPHALNRVWNYNFARAQNVYDKMQHKGTTMEARPPLLDPRAADWVDLIAEQIHSDRDLDLNTIAYQRKMDLDILWSHSALWMLHHDKDTLVEFLSATSSLSIPSPWVADCLQVLAAHYIQSDTAVTYEYVTRLNKIFCALAESPRGQHINFDGRYIRMVLPYSTAAQISDLYRAIRLGDMKVHTNTLMHLTGYFAKHDHFHQALDVLLDAHRNGAVVDAYPFRSNCGILMRKAIEQPGGLRVCLRIVDNLVKIGVRLNRRLCNILILNAVDVGDTKTAHDIYHSLVDHNARPDKYTHAIMLKGCKLDIDNADALNHTITNAIKDVSVTDNPVMAVEILHCLALHHTRNSGEDAWSTICQAYAQIFELDPLVQLGLPIPLSVRTTPLAKKPMPVPAQAIGIMLRTYLKLAFDFHGTNHRIQEIYQRYRTLVSQRKEPFASTASTTHCFNAFLGVFIKHKRNLVNAAELIKDMQNYAASSPPIAVVPDVQSWSIFLNGFSQHGQTKLAEQVLGYMRGKGLEPNAVTWNSLMAGYAGMQDFEGVQETMRRFDEHGHAWDEWTYGGLRRFRNSEQLQAAMKARGKDLKLDFTDELKEGLGARLNEFEG